MLREKARSSAYRIYPLLLIFVFLCSLGLPASDANWPRFRGPDGTGISQETDWDPLTLSKGSDLLWKVAVGKGYSSVSIQGDYLYTMGNEDGKDTVYCLEFDTGRVVWAYSYNQSLGQYPGPRATPTVDEDRLYTLSQFGDLYCLDALNGRVIWKKNMERDFRAGSPGWGFAASPCVVDDFLIINAGTAGIALDKHSGRVIWSNAPGRGGYATPTTYTFRGQRRVAIFGQDSLYGVELESGKVLWQVPWRNSSQVNAADPIVIGERIFISSAYNSGCALIKMEGSGVSVVWQNRNMNNHFASSLYYDGYLYGIDGDARYRNATLRCLDPDDGSVVWSTDFGTGSLMAAAGYLILLSEDGDLVIAKAEPASYYEIARARVTGRTAWTAPVLCRGRIVCRNVRGELVCVDVR